MSYQITYDPGIRKKPQKSFRVLLFTILFLYLFLLTNFTSLAKGKDVIKEILFPGDPQRIQEATQTLVEDLQSGDSFSEALEAFCSQLIL